MKNRFQLILSATVFTLIMLGVLLFVNITRENTYNILVEQSLESNRIVGESILALINRNTELGKVTDNKLSVDSKLVMEVQSVCDILKLPNDGFVCAADAQGTLLAFPGSKEVGTKIDYAKYKPFQFKQDGTLEGKPTGSVSYEEFYEEKNYKGLYDYPESDYSDVILGITHESGLKILIHQNHNLIQQMADRQSKMLLLYGFLIALVISIAAYVFVNKRVAIYQKKILLQRESLEKAYDDIKVKNQEITNQNESLKNQKEEIASQAEKLQKLDKAKSKFFSSITHELRTPLTLISSPLENLVHSYKTELPVKVNEQLALVQRNSKKLKTLVDDILDFSKLETNKVEVNEEPTHLISFLKRVASNFDYWATSKKIHFTKSFQLTEESYVLLDASKVEKVLDNLLSNAMKFTPSDGEVSINASINDSNILIEVIDTGKGIDTSDIPHIFNRFYQSKNQEKFQQSGTGIGLAYANELTQLMEGELTVKSELYKGSRFVFKLTYKDVSTFYKRESVLQEKNTITQHKYNLNTKLYNYTILIVEDNSDMLLYVYSLLKDYYKVIKSVNGKEAWDIINKQDVDLIITDVMMPEIDGFGLVEKLKSSDKLLGIPVIMLTALSSEELKLKALTIGVDDYLIKPFSSQELLVRTSNLLERYQIRKSIDTEVLSGEIISDEQLTNDEIESNEVMSSDLTWLRKVEMIIREELENEEFQIAQLASEFFLSERQFRRRLKKVVGLSPKKYQQEIALQKARELLENKVYDNATAVAQSVGINHVTRFSQLFEERFGKKPKEYFS